MRAAPVTRVVTAGLTRRWRPAVVISLVLTIFAAASLLAAALVVDVRGPFDYVFNAQHGAQLTATADLSRATMGQLAATARLPGVAATSRPFAETTLGRPGAPVTVRQAGRRDPLAPMTLAGRASAGGPVNDVALVTGHWARQAGQIVLRFGYQDGRLPVGSWLTVTGLPGAPRLEVVGLAVSISDSADAWVVPAEIARLRPPGTRGPRRCCTGSTARPRPSAPTSPR